MPKFSQQLDIGLPAMPYSKEAERAFLGSILLGAPPLQLDEVAESDFFLPHHRVICAHLKKLHRAGIPTNDSVLLYESLNGDSQIEEAGGVSYLSQLPDGLPSTTNLEHYAKIIRDKAEARRRMYAYKAGLDRLAEANGNLAEVLVEDAKAFESCFTPRVGVETNRILFKTAAEAPTFEQTEWLVKGLVPKGGIVSVNAKIKAGKTTFVLAACRRVIEGLEFLGEPTTQTNVVYLTEQPASSFDRAIQLAGLRGFSGFSYLHFTQTCGLEWAKVADMALARCKATNAGVLVVDTLSKFAGIDDENDAGEAQRAMVPLEKIAAEKISVIVLRHGRKSGGDIEDAARGSSAYDGHADLIISIKRPEGNAPENRRLLTSTGRYEGETHNDLLIELTPEGSYIAIGSEQETALKDAKEAILAIAPGSELDAATIAELAENSKTSKVTASRACDELFKAGELQRSGKGKKGSPYLFWKEKCDSFQPHSWVENTKTNFGTLREPGEEG